MRFLVLSTGVDPSEDYFSSMRRVFEFCRYSEMPLRVHTGDILWQENMNFFGRSKKNLNMTHYSFFTVFLIFNSVFKLVDFATM